MAASIHFRNGFGWTTSSSMLEIVSGWLADREPVIASWLADHEGLSFLPLSSIADDLGEAVAEATTRHLAGIADVDVAADLVVEAPPSGRRDLWELRLLARSELGDVYRDAPSPPTPDGWSGPGDEPVEVAADGVRFATRYFWRTNLARGTVVVDAIAAAVDAVEPDLLMQRGRPAVDLAAIEQRHGRDTAVEVCRALAGDELAAALAPPPGDPRNDRNRPNADAEVLQLMAAEQLITVYGQPT